MWHQCVESGDPLFLNLISEFLGFDTRWWSSNEFQYVKILNIFIKLACQLLIDTDLVSQNKQFFKVLHCTLMTQSTRYKNK